LLNELVVESTYYFKDLIGRKISAQLLLKYFSLWFLNFYLERLAILISATNTMSGFYWGALLKAFGTHLANFGTSF